MKLSMSIVYATLNGINQIISKSLYQIDSTAYNKPYRKFLKKLMGYNGVMDEHHIFPRCLRNHPVLYDIEFNSGKNLKIMPNRRCKKIIKYTKQNENDQNHDDHEINIVLKHESHVAYTKYVKTQLDYINPYGEDRQYQIWLLLGHLEQNLNFENQIPFKSINKIKYK